MEKANESDPLVVYAGEIQTLLGRPQGERSAQAVIETRMRQVMSEKPIADYLAAKAEQSRLDVLYEGLNKLDVGPENTMDVPGLLQDLSQQRTAAEEKAYKLGETQVKELARLRLYAQLWENVTGKEWGSEKVSLTPLIASGD